MLNALLGFFLQEFIVGETYSSFVTWLKMYRSEYEIGRIQIIRF